MYDEEALKLNFTADEDIKYIVHGIIFLSKKKELFKNAKSHSGLKDEERTKWTLYCPTKLLMKNLSFTCDTKKNANVTFWQI